MAACAGSASASHSRKPWWWSCGCFKQDLEKVEQVEVCQGDFAEQRDKERARLQDATTVLGEHRVVAESRPGECSGAPGDLSTNTGAVDLDAATAPARGGADATVAGQAVAEEEAAAPREAEAVTAEDEQVMRRVRLLCAREAHFRALAVLEAHQESLRRSGPLGAAERFQAICESDEEVRRLRYKVEVLAAASRHLGYEKEDDDGGHGQQSHAWSTYHKIGSRGGSAELWAHAGKDSKPTFHIKSFFKEPVDHILSLYYEIDLYHRWLPFVWEAKRLHVVRGCGDYAQFIVLLRYCLPWPLKNREAVVYGFASERLENGQVLLCASSIPEEATEWWGYPIPPAGSAIRMDVSFEIGFAPEAPGGEHTCMDVIFKLDPKVEWLSQNLLTWAGRQFVTQLYNSIAGICKEFSKSPYPARLSADECGAYNVMYQALMAHRRGELPEDAHDINGAA